MIRTNGVSQALFGGLLWGDRALRFIFVDEAGKAQNEPITVVVGIVADADVHVVSADAAVREVLGAVPAQFRKDFAFHAMQIYGDRKYHDHWSLTDRLGMLKFMMSIPRALGMGIVVAAHYRGHADLSAYESIGLSGAKAEHFHTFVQCIAKADAFIRRYGRPHEVGTVVAEDEEEMRTHLRDIPKRLRLNPIHLPPSQLRRTKSDEETGYLIQTGDLRVTRIRSPVHFVKKEDDPIVQVADAVAYGIARYLNGKKFGKDFAEAILGHSAEKCLQDFAPPGGAEIYHIPARS